MYRRGWPGIGPTKGSPVAAQGRGPVRTSPSLHSSGEPPASSVDTAAAEALRDGMNSAALFRIAAVVSRPAEDSNPENCLELPSSSSPDADVVAVKVMSGALSSAGEPSADFLPTS
mmetsp:Transcript_25047/g.44636  ORF Transcript_25047/g.44636 Transcript_25047/m.44636 type:complete len:116 (-) Transcript_25047:702-1049(-)